MSANENQLQIEVLQPEISSQIHKATRDELKNWIKDGKLKPTHQIRIKNLNWIEAQKIPVFQALFEAKNNDLTAQPSQFNNQTFLNSSFPKPENQKINEAAIPSKKMPSAASIKNEPNDITVKNKAKIAEPSIAFKIYEKKVLAKSQKIESKNEHIESKTKIPRHLPEKPKKSLFLKKSLGFLAGCFFVFLLSLGSSYLWVYQLKTPAKIDEKNVPELSGLSFKLTADKLDLRLKAAAENKESNTGNQEQTVQKFNFNQEAAKLESQFKNQSKNIVENYQNKLQNDNFNNTFYLSFAVLLIMFFIIRVFYGKTAEPSANQYLPKLSDIQHFDSLNSPATAIEKVNLEDFQHADSVNSFNVQITKPLEEDQIDCSKTTETIGESFHTNNNADAAESSESGNCLFHQDESSQFFCENCSNYFCEECSQTFDQQENCCPLCKIACKSVDADFEEATSPQPAEQEKTNLLDSGANTDFVVYDYPDQRRRKLGIIPAFVIAVLFSSSISVFWVYKISPYLENRNKETSQNVSPNKTQEPKKGNEIKTSQLSDNQNAASEISANQSCIDPQTKQPFECDEQTKMALQDHTAKVKSVEKAQKETAEKTNSILSLILPSSSSASENANQDAVNSVDAARKELEKQQLIKVFIYSFLIIFGLQLSTGLFSKEKRPE